MFLSRRMPTKEQRLEAFWEYINSGANTGDGFLSDIWLAACGWMERQMLEQKEALHVGCELTDNDRIYGKRCGKCIRCESFMVRQFP